MVKTALPRTVLTLLLITVSLTSTLPADDTLLYGWQYDQLKPRVAYNSQADEFLLVMEDHHWGNGNDWDIFGQRVNNQGQPTGGHLDISWLQANHRLSPDIAYNPTGNEYLVVWEYESSATNHDIYAARLNGDGTLAITEFPVANSTRHERNPAVAYQSTTNEYLVVWEEHVGSDIEFPDNDIMARSYDPESSTLSSPVTIASGSADQSAPAIAAGDVSTDKFMVVWQEQVTPAVLPYTIRGQMTIGNTLHASGFDISSVNANDQRNPRIACNAIDTQFMIVWEYRHEHANHWDIIGKLTDSVGFPIGQPFAISWLDTKRRMLPEIAFSSADREFLAIWQYEFGPGDMDVIGRRISSSGKLIGTETPIANTGNTEQQPALVFDHNHNALIVWEDSRNSATTDMGLDLYGQFGPRYDFTPPVARIDSPVFFGCACPEIVTVTGEACDPDGVLADYTLEYRGVNAPPGTAWTEIIYNASPVCGSGILAHWNVSGLAHGYYYLRLIVTNGSDIIANDVTTAYVDHVFNTLEFTSPPPDAIVGGEVCIWGTVYDNHCFSEYAVQYAPGLSGGVWTPIPRTKAPDQTSIHEHIATWESTLVPDGDYRIKVEAVDICGNAGSETHNVTIDNTPPVALITLPESCTPQEGTIEIYGTADDANLARWTLQYTGDGVNGWQTIDSMTTPVINDLLGTWETAGLPGCCYTIRLVVTDKATINCNELNTHRAEFNVSLNMGGLSADINGDGKVDLQDFTELAQQWLMGT